LFRSLLQTSTVDMHDFQRVLCVQDAVVNSWQLTHSKNDEGVNLLDVIVNAKPTILIGVSGQAGIFTKAVIEAMQANCARPIVLPLSNPTSQVEAQPVDILRWTGGKAIVATGSPFAPVDIGNQHFEIAQCNNSYIFPGVGLGVIAAKASRVTEGMMMSASRALANASPMVQHGTGALLPPLSEIRMVSKIIARAVFMQAIVDGVALPVPEELIDARIDANFWTPEYRYYRRTSF